MTGYRMEDGLDRGEPFHFTCDGEPVLAYPGESIAAALFAAGRRKLRTTARLAAPRGLYCGMGVCWECIMVVDGAPAVRACMTAAAPGMRVETQRGLGPTVAT
ncbi:MAG: (2Fe-2S)-binding protein [Alphaproteobacteria bacterium]